MQADSLLGMSENCKQDEPIPMLTWVPSTIGLRLNYDGQAKSTMPGMSMSTMGQKFTGFSQVLNKNTTGFKQSGTMLSSKGFLGGAGQTQAP